MYPVKDGQQNIDILHGLQENRFFRTLSGSALTEAATVARCRVYQRGELAVHATDISSNFFVILRGQVSFYRLAPDGRKLRLGTQNTGDVFWFSSREGVTAAKNCVEILADGTILCRFPLGYIWQLMATQPSFASRLFDQVWRRLMHYCDRIEDLTFAPVATRLAHTLAERARDSDERIVTETHDELAWLIGASRATVTKALAHLRDLGLIDYKPHQHGIRVVDLERLAAYQIADHESLYNSSP